MIRQWVLRPNAQSINAAVRSGECETLSVFKHDLIAGLHLSDDFRDHMHNVAGMRIGRGAARVDQRHAVTYRQRRVGAAGLTSLNLNVNGVVSVGDRWSDQNVTNERMPCRLKAERYRSENVRLRSDGFRMSLVRRDKEIDDAIWGHFVRLERRNDARTGATAKR